MWGRVVASDKHRKRSVAGAAEHEQQHYSTDDDALAGRAFCGSTTPARGSRQTQPCIENRIEEVLKSPKLVKLIDELYRYL